MEQLTYHIKTFGCQMNKFDSAEFARFFESLGMAASDSAADASLVHVNTCCVRQKAEDKFFSFLGELRILKESNPSMIIGVSGCIPELRDVLKHHSYVNYVAGSRAPEKYFDQITEAIEKKHGPVQKREPGAARPVIATDENGVSVEFADSPASAFLTIIRGCTNMCTYCVVPRVRGPETSRPLAEIREDADRIIQGGASEIILLGQNVLAYGGDLEPRLSLLDAIATVHRIPGLKRLRFVTSHPAWITEEFLLGLKSFPLVCEHFHIPCQAGDDDILKRMNRRYTAAEYAEKIAMIRHHFPAAGITADVIVGFPGETEAQFENTMALMRQVVVSATYMFNYSPRPGTVALGMEDDVPAAVKTERIMRLIEQQKEISVRLNRALIESRMEVMIDEVMGMGRYKGRTRCNRITDFVSIRPLKPGDIVEVLIKSASPHALNGLLFDLNL